MHRLRKTPELGSSWADVLNRTMPLQKGWRAEIYLYQLSPCYDYMIAYHVIVHLSFRALGGNTSKGFRLKCRHIRHALVLRKIAVEKFISRNGAEIFACHFLGSDDKDRIVFFGSRREWVTRTHTRMDRRIIDFGLSHFSWCCWHGERLNESVEVREEDARMVRRPPDVAQPVSAKLTSKSAAYHYQWHPGLNFYTLPIDFQPVVKSDLRILTSYFRIS